MIDDAGMRLYYAGDTWKPLIFAVGLAVLCAILEWALRRRAGKEASILWVPERLRLSLRQGDGFLRRTRQIWLVWLMWVAVLVGLWFLAESQLDLALAPWIMEYGEELIRDGLPESWIVLRERLEADVAPWKWL